MASESEDGNILTDGHSHLFRPPLVAGGWLASQPPVGGSYKMIMIIIILVNSADEKNYSHEQ